MDKRLLIVEDDLGLQSQLKWAFDGYQVLLAGNQESALAQLRRFEPPVVSLDLGLPPDADGAREGLETLREILSLAPHSRVIVVTGNSDRANAVKAIAMGAFDFYQKPVDVEILRLLVDRAFWVYELELENRRLTTQQLGAPLRGIIASSPQMLKACKTVEKVAPTDVSVLLLGESGTGKELLARALHELSSRAGKPFVAINCAAIPENLLESELFGYERGAFTGAAKRTLGKIECADQGTLFLDEIGDLPTALQAKLLRFLQERVIERLGGREQIPVDVRVICATHQDIPTRVRQEAFREDLYYRISEITIRIPPLREREGDAVVLARTFFDVYSRQHGRGLRGFTDDALAAIQHYDWPGNVRELENKVRRAVIMAEGSRVAAADLELSALQEAILPLNLREVRDEAERRTVKRAMLLAEGNVSKAAELLGVTRPTLYDLLKKHNLSVS